MDCLIGSLTVGKLTELTGRIDNSSYFYNHFVNEENVESISDKRALRQLKKYSLSLMTFIAAGVPFSLIGMFKIDILDRFYLGFGLLLFAYQIYYFICFLLIYSHYRIFKKKWMLLLFSLPFILYPVFILLNSLANLYLFPFIGDGFKPPINQLETFILTLPLMIVYVVFCVYCYRACILKYPLDSAFNINSLHR